MPVLQYAVSVLSVAITIDGQGHTSSETFRRMRAVRSMGISVDGSSMVDEPQVPECSIPFLLPAPQSLRVEGKKISKRRR